MRPGQRRRGSAPGRRPSAISPRRPPSDGPGRDDLGQQAGSGCPGAPASGGPSRAPRRRGTGSWRRGCTRPRWRRTASARTGRPSSAAGPRCRSSGSSVADHREQLVERVDGHELDAGGGVDLGPAARSRRPPPACRRSARRGSGPGSRAGARARRAGRSPRPTCPRRPRPRVPRPRPCAGRPRCRRTAQGVPVQRAADGHGDVGEAVDVLHREPPAVEGAHDDAPALGPEVDGGEPQRSRSVKAEHLLEAAVEARRRVRARVDQRAMSACQRSLTGGAAIFARKRSKSSTSNTPISCWSSR